MEEIRMKPIGVVHTPFKDPVGVPIQPSAARGIKGHVEVFPEYEEGLTGIEGFSHIILLFYFHRAAGFSLRVKPYLDSEMRGVFATRAPRRPNHIGLSVVHLLGVDGRMLYIEDVDIVDGTPLLDIKPYVPEFDIREVERKGWLEKRIHRLNDARDDGRFAAEKSLKTEKD